MNVILNSELLQKIAGWQVVKEARSLVAAGRVAESTWTPPELRGVVHTSAGTFKTGLTIHSVAQVETHCPCRAAQREGIICAHAIAVALHVLQPPPRTPAPSAPAAPGSMTESPGAAVGPAATASVRRLRRATPGEPAQVLRLHVILPPNLVEAANRGKVTVAIEAERDGRRAPLNTVPRDLPVRLGPEDESALEVVEAIAGEPAGVLVMPALELGRLLPALAAHPRVTLGRAQALEVSRSPLRLNLSGHLEPEGEIVLRLKDAAPTSFPTGAGRWSLIDNRLVPLSLPPLGAGILEGAVRVGRAQVPEFLTRQWPALLASAVVELDFDLDRFELDVPAPQFRLRLAGGLARLEAELRAQYPGRTCVAARLEPGEGPWTSDPTHPTRYTARNLAGEQAALGRLLRSGFSAPDAEGRCHLRGEDAVLTFFAREYPRLLREWEVTLEERLQRSTATKLERIEPSFRITGSGEQWFELRVDYQSRAGSQLPAAEIQRLLLSGRAHTRLPSGRVAVLDTGAVEELQQVLLDCDPQQQAGGYRIGSERAGFLGATLREQRTWRVDAPAAWRERVRVQTGELDLACPQLGSLEGVLRPYQKAGVGWLWFLRQSGFGGVLADEMGLGKTLQALALLAAIRLRGTPGPPPSLVVCPTSLVSNWVAEAQRFTPFLRVLAWHGAGRRERLEPVGQSDLVVTSYALVRRDIAHYQGIEFDTVILDEAQHIKNRSTQNAQAVKAIRSRHRLALTGTPLENSVLDLWSLFDFLMPGYLGPAKDFRERYELPIARDRDATVQARLSRRVRPFLLRRLKREVAAELPARLEQVAYCDLTPDQARVYRQLLEAGRNEVLAAVGREGLARSRMVVLTTLLRLRQVCCDLRLLKLPDVPPEAASAKLDLLAELLEEIVDGGHRALVFSQFTSMLALVRERLEADGLMYCYLDGSTPDRGAVVARFQAQPDIPVFLISLKAGGTGLNLTGADTVVHFDPWWNPAVEAQATDRAHRIGQTRVVTSYKLIARATVEEKILHLQQRKRAVLEATLGDDAEFAAALDWEDVQSLLSDRGTVD